MKENSIQTIRGAHRHVSLCNCCKTFFFLIITKKDQCLYFHVPNSALPNADSLIGTLMKTIKYTWIMRPKISLRSAYMSYMRRTRIYDKSLVRLKARRNLHLGIGVMGRMTTGRHVGMWACSVCLLIFRELKAVYWHVDELWLRI